MQHQSPIIPIDPRQRYSIPESAKYLRIGRAYLYRLIARGELQTITDGTRRFVPGSEIIRRSTLPA
jgi:excisionase family DNA binding protein